MIYRISLLFSLISVGCSASTDMVIFGNLEIPESYVLHKPGDSPNGVFDESSQTIALVIPEEEVQSFIPEYQSKQRGSKTVSIVLYEDRLDLAAISASAWSLFGAGTSAIDEDKHTNFTRYYRDSDSWLLAGNNAELVAICRMSGISGEIEICDFKTNLESFGVTYHLQNENIALAKQFESFLADKLGVWSK